MNSNKYHHALRKTKKRIGSVKRFIFQRVTHQVNAWTFFQIQQDQIIHHWFSVGDRLRGRHILAQLHGKEESVSVSHGHLEESCQEFWFGRTTDALLQPKDLHRSSQQVCGLSQF